MDEHSDIKGLIFKIRRFSVHDGPGIRTTVFLKGCPLSCIWCHSPEGISDRIIVWHNENICIRCEICIKSCPSDALRLSAGLSDTISIDYNKCELSGNCIQNCPTEAMQFTGYIARSKDVMNEILKDRLFYLKSEGGVTLTGGEPLAQSEFSYTILKACRIEGIHTAVETSLFCDRDILKQILPVTDLFIADLKLLADEEHIKHTGRSNKLILDNFIYIAMNGAEVLARIPMIPGITDSDDNIRSIKDFVRSVNDKIPVEIIPFNPLARNNYKRLGLPYRVTGE